MTTRELKIKTYHAWHNMIRRCYDSTMEHYQDYGGRGIKVCARWLDPTDGYKNFVEDQGYAPSKDHSNGRINNDGDYEPGNVEWQLWDVQYRNKRPHSKTVWVHINGLRMSISEFCTRCKMGHNLYHQSNMTLDEFVAKYAYRFDNPNPSAFDPKDRPNVRVHNYKGERVSQSEFARRISEASGMKVLPQHIQRMLTRNRSDEYIIDYYENRAKNEGRRK